MLLLVLAAPDNFVLQVVLLHKSIYFDNHVLVAFGLINRVENVLWHVLEKLLEKSELAIFFFLDLVCSW